MNCFFCKGTLEDKPTVFLADIENCIIIVKNVPSQVCTQCGETSYTDDVVSQLEIIIGETKKTMTEIAVVQYTNHAA